jgi:hypothetical protein
VLGSSEAEKFPVVASIAADVLSAPPGPATVTLTEPVAALVPAFTVPVIVAVDALYVTAGARRFVNVGVARAMTSVPVAFVAV